MLGFEPSRVKVQIFYFLGLAVFAPTFIAMLPQVKGDQINIVCQDADGVWVCPDCGDEYDVHNKAAHVANCVLRKVVCKCCSKVVTQAQYFSHLTHAHKLGDAFANSCVAEIADEPVPVPSHRKKPRVERDAAVVKDIVVDVDGAHFII